MASCLSSDTDSGGDSRPTASRERPVRPPVPSRLGDALCEAGGTTGAARGGVGLALATRRFPATTEVRNRRPGACRALTIQCGPQGPDPPHPPEPPRVPGRWDVELGDLWGHSPLSAYPWLQSHPRLPRRLSHTLPPMWATLHTYTLQLCFLNTPQGNLYLF